ncbi:MAG: hypothetical protein M3P99_04880 [Pseudomonadota bacterium]|nr:hypothetical protein [Pseudomonadota bacterium]
MQTPLNISRSGPYFAVFFLVALIAFWPSYLSPATAPTSIYTHGHAMTSSLWMLLLIAQPLAIRTRRLGLHRRLGKASYGLAPLVLVTIVLLAHSRISGVSGEAYAIQTYILYLQISLAILFGVSYALGIFTRHTAALHARFMVCTGLTLIDPVVIRMMFWIDPTPTWNYQWFTFGLTDLMLVVLIVLDRHSRVGRAVFPAMLAAFVALQVPALFELTAGAPWQQFARWFAALPLT